MRQVFRRERHRGTEFLNDCGCDLDRLPPRHPMDDAVTHRRDRRELRSCLEPFQQKSGLVAAHPHLFTWLVFRLPRQHRLSRTGAIDVSSERASHRRTDLVEREPDARRAGVDGQHGFDRRHVSALQATPDRHERTLISGRLRRRRRMTGVCVIRGEISCQ